MKRKALIASIAGLTAVFTLAAAGMEWNGYHAFDSKDGENLLCTIDPTCRRMTEGEIEMARSVFGEAIDYRSVKIFHRDYFGFLNHNRTILSPNGNIYIPRGVTWSKDYSTEDEWGKGLLMHELTHVWQAQTGKRIPAEALDNLVSYDFNYQSSYNYSLKQHNLFSDYNIEQQASMVEDYISKRFGLEDKIDSTDDVSDIARYKAEDCPNLRLLGAKIAQVLPVEKLTDCPEPPLPQSKRRSRKHYPKP